MLATQGSITIIYSLQDDKEPQGENASFINDQNEEEIKEIREGAGEDSEKPQTDDKPTERKKESTSEEITGPIVEKVPVDATSEEPVQTSKGNEDRELETTETGEETGTGPEDKGIIIRFDEADGINN